ncbi:MAG: hemerythrin domain-containing protein [Gammaproteobacteria bacterium]|nr:hemerythrin domain-containing protein [Gammaproteobacteria bacterium]
MTPEIFEARFLLGVAAMDTTHRQFIVQLQQLQSAPKAEFIPLFAALFQHTVDHFETERGWMEQFRFPAIREHTAEHERVLGELQRFNDRVAKGNIALGRAYIREQLPGWFELHAQTMDSALAATIKAAGGIS